MVSLLPRARCLSLLLGLSPNMEQAKQIHAHMITTALLRDEDHVAALVNAYSAAAALLPPERGGGGAHSLAAWNAILRCCTTLFTSLTSASASTYTLLLQACARCYNAPHLLRQLHAQVLKTGLLASDLAIQTTTIHSYGACGDIDSARRVFDGMSSSSSSSAAPWNAMMGVSGEALKLFRRMLSLQVRPTDRTAVVLISACSRIGDLSVGSSIHAFICKSAITSCYHVDCVYIGTGLVDMYSKCGCLASARSVFQQMRRQQRNVLAWSAMIAGLAFHGQGRAAVEMLDEMQEAGGVRPNAVTFTCLLSACCHAGLVQDGLRLFHAMESRFGVAPRMQHYGCIVDLLGRAGLVEEAYEVVRGMPVEPDAVVWRALLGACNIHGRSELGEAVGKILLRMEQQQQQQQQQWPGSSRAGGASEDLVALSNVYASAERWDDVSELREAMGLPNKPGISSSFTLI